MGSRFDQQKAFRVVYYEIAQLAAAYQEYHDPKRRNAAVSEDNEKVVRNALFESCLIHLRALVDFFCNRPLQDDILISHFGDQRLDKWMVSVKDRGRINKSLAHITEARLKYLGDETKEWKSFDDDVCAALAKGKMFLEEFRTSFASSQEPTPAMVSQVIDRIARLQGRPGEASQRPPTSFRADGGIGSPSDKNCAATQLI